MGVGNGGWGVGDGGWGVDSEAVDGYYSEQDNNIVGRTEYLRMQWGGGQGGGRGVVGWGGGGEGGGCGRRQLGRQPQFHPASLV